MTDQERLELFRKHVESVWSTPTVADTVRFINQELGEADSVAMKLGFQDKEYKRSNELEELELKYALRLELGQTYMMLLTYASLVGIDLTHALKEAMADRLGLISLHISDSAFTCAWNAITT